MNKLTSLNRQGSNQRPLSGLVSVALFSFLLWICVGLIHAMGLSYDDPTEAIDSGYALFFFRVVLYFIPYAVLNAGLAVLFWYRAALLLQPKIMVLTVILSLIIGIPAQSMVETLLPLLLTGQPLKLFWNKWLGYSTFSLWLIACFLMLMYFSQAAFAIWRRNVESELELANSENERIELRLHLLQGQLKPHFLFNALNSISALVRGADRQLAARALQQLSGLLSYVAHASKQEWLTVADEIQFVRDYVDMQNLRFGDRMQIEWEIEKQSWELIACAPLLFQPLIENAIHHGVEPHHEKCNIKIRLYLINDLIHFVIENSVFFSTLTREGHGLGLSSTKERIALLFGGKARLAINSDEKKFNAHLSFPRDRLT